MRKISVLDRDLVLGKFNFWQSNSKTLSETELNVLMNRKNRFTPTLRNLFKVTVSWIRRDAYLCLLWLYGKQSIGVVSVCLRNWRLAFLRCKIYYGLHFLNWKVSDKMETEILSCSEEKLLASSSKIFLPDYSLLSNGPLIRMA